MPGMTGAIPGAVPRLRQLLGELGFSVVTVFDRRGASGLPITWEMWGRGDVQVIVLTMQRLPSEISWEVFVQASISPSTETFLLELREKLEQLLAAAPVIAAFGEERHDDKT